MSKQNKVNNRQLAKHPEDLPILFLKRANTGDADGLSALYEADALLVSPDGQHIKGRKAIREFYEELLADQPMFEAGDHRPVLLNGNIALTSSRLVSGMITAEIARKQADETWLWAVDQPAINR